MRNRSVSSSSSSVITQEVIMDSPFKYQSRSNPPPNSNLNSNFNSGSSFTRFQLLTRSVSPNSKSQNANSSSKFNGNGLLYFTVSAALLVVLLVSAVATGWRFNLGGSGKRSGSGKGYTIIIDAGSTGSRIHVFTYSVDVNGAPVMEIPTKDNSATMRTTPGLSSFEKDVGGAGKSVARLLDFAKDTIPAEQWGETEVRLMATAGLRRLKVDAQERVLDACRSVIGLSGFKFRKEWASVIAGADEGIYAWVAANYALGSLGGDPQETVGIIELGGASAQITFIPRDRPPLEFLHELNVGGVPYNLYSHSLLDFGQNVAHESLHEFLNSREQLPSLPSASLHDPCVPKGYSHGRNRAQLPSDSNTYLSIPAVGNFSECRSAAAMLLQKGNDKCLYPPCNIGSSFIPQLQGKFLATENFFFTSKFFGLASTASLSDLMEAGQSFCAEDWSKLKMHYPAFDEEDLTKYCFSSAYIVALLHDRLGVSMDDRRIVFANQVGEISIEWALGAFVLLMLTNKEAPKTNWVVSNFWMLFSAATIISLAILITWATSKCRKAQFKTIYDLEKGRYIITRISSSSR